MIQITAKFIEGTKAKGCFAVFQCEYGSPDVFRALLLPNLNSVIIDVPASTYSMLVYDLEEDGLPNTKPAVEQSRTVTVEGGGKCLLIYYTWLTFVTDSDSVSDIESLILKRASFVWSGLAVSFTCEFKEGIEGASCVLVYREYGDETLVVVEYPQNSTVFPVTLSVGSGQYYTFAIFGKHGSNLDQRPIVMRHVQVIRTTPTATPPVTNSGMVSHCSAHQNFSTLE